MVAVNRAVAIARLRGACEGLTAIDSADLGNTLDTYQPHWAARAELLAAAGDAPGAQRAFERAIGLCVDPAIRRHLITRAERLRRGDRA